MPGTCSALISGRKAVQGMGVWEVTLWIRNIACQNFASDHLLHRLLFLLASLCLSFFHFVFSVCSTSSFSFFSSPFFFFCFSPLTLPSHLSPFSPYSPAFVRPLLLLFLNSFSSSYSPSSPLPPLFSPLLLSSSSSSSPPFLLLPVPTARVL